MNAWQDIIALAAVALAAGYIAWRVACKVFQRSSSRCGGCSNCASSDAKPAPQQLVTLAPPKAGPPRE